jgi:hypothetical protein
MHSKAVLPADLNQTFLPIHSVFEVNDDFGFDRRSHRGWRHGAYWAARLFDGQASGARRAQREPLGFEVLILGFMAKPQDPGGPDPLLYDSIDRCFVNTKA